MSLMSDFVVCWTKETTRVFLKIYFNATLREHRHVFNHYHQNVFIYRYNKYVIVTKTFKHNNVCFKLLFGTSVVSIDL